jgi:hypothetical protein
MEIGGGHEKPGGLKPPGYFFDEGREPYFK